MTTGPRRHKQLEFGSQTERANGRDCAHPTALGVQECPFGATWYQATAEPVGERKGLAHDLDVEVCIIGGGLAGLTVAREVARRGGSVALLESQRLAWNASGRNGGVVLPGFAERIERIIDRVGLTQARELWALSVEGVAYVRRAMAELGMSALQPVDGFLRAARTDDPTLGRHVAMLRSHFAADVERWPTEQVRDLLRTRCYFQGLHWPRALVIDPLTYARGLASAAERDGARIFEATRALAIDTAGLRKHVDTPAGRVRARHLVLAGGAHLGALVPALSGTLVPVLTHVGTSVRLGARLHDAIRFSGAVADPRPGCDFYRIVDHDRLLWGSGIATQTTSPRRLLRYLQRRISAVYPQLGPVDLAYAWSGMMSYAVHKMPQIGEVAPGVWLASAFGGRGLNTTAMAGELLARAILEGDDRWRLFCPYELVWAGGALGRRVAQVLFWTTGAKDAVREALARRGDRAAEQPAVSPATDAWLRQGREPTVAALETCIDQAASRAKPLPATTVQRAHSTATLARPMPKEVAATKTPAARAELAGRRHRKAQREAG